MSPQEDPTAASEPAQLRFYPVIHPEFGYLVPARGLRHKAALVGKGIAIGAIVGAVAGLALLPDSGARLQSTFSMQTQAAGDMLATAPVRFVAATLAIPAAAESPSTVGLAASPPAAAAPTRAIAADPPEHQAAPKPKKKVARQPKRERNAPVKLDPRRFDAGPYRREPYYSSNDRPRFGLGW